MRDLGITQDGELIFDTENSDITTRKEDDLIKQIAINRIKSIKGDWFNQRIGADVEEFIGMVSNKVTCDAMIERITEELCNDSFLVSNSLFFVPRIEERYISLILFIKKKFGEGPMIINIELDIIGGVKIQYDTDS